MSLDATYLSRLSKAALTAAAASWSLLVACNNVFDYASNLEFVRHVLEMDTTFPGNAGMWRAIHAPLFHHAAYALIIVVEFAVGVIAGLGALRMLRARGDAGQFRQAKGLAVAGLTLGILLWLVGFEVVAGEWFMMWQSRTWNAQESAFRFATAFSVILVFVSLDD